MDKPTPEDLAKEEADPTVAVLMTTEGVHIRYIRQSEYDKMKELSQKLLDDPEFWND